MTPVEIKLASITAKNGSFSNVTPGLQLVWDSTSLGALKTCPWKYYLSLIEGWQPKNLSIHLSFGLAFHEGVELYEELKAAGSSHDEAVYGVTQQALESCGTREPKSCGCTQCDQTMHAKTGEESWTYECSNCGLETDPQEGRDTTFRPWESTEAGKTRYTAVRALVWYFEIYKNDPAEVVILDNGKPAVELSFRFDIDLKSQAGETYQLAGHMDKLVNFSNQNYVMDHKTSKSLLTSYFFESFNPSNQMTLYTVAGKVILDKPVSGVIINGVQAAAGFNRYARGFSMRTPVQLEDWFEDAKAYMTLAETYAKSGHWPMNDTACSHYGGCDFKDICTKDPAVREKFLESKFIRRTWDPTVPR